MGAQQADARTGEVFVPMDVSVDARAVLSELGFENNPSERAQQRSDVIG